MLEISTVLRKFLCFRRRENLFGIRYSSRILYVFRAMPLTRVVSRHEFPLVKGLHKILRNSFNRLFVTSSRVTGIFIILLGHHRCRKKKHRVF